MRSALPWLLRSSVLLGALQVSTAASALPKDAEAMRLLDEGQVKYKAEQFGEAIEDFKRGYEIEPDPAFLIAWAQAERQRGRCTSAVRLYKRFLATDPPEVAQEFARDGLVRCAEQLAENPDPEDDEADDDEDESLVAEPEAPDEDEAEAVPAPTRDREHWIRDGLGTSLFAVGVVGTGVGTGLLVASALRQRQLDADIDDMTVNYGEFDERRRGIRNLRIAGGAVVGVGAALLVGGIVRWAVVGSRKKASAPSVGFMLHRDHAGLTISGRF
jgi:tetratricopeptide (TPR) repeat protein